MGIESKIAYLQDNLPFYAVKYIKIRPKEGGRLIPLKFNNAQMMLHKRLESIRAEGEPVRVVICKGRQQGCSTYVASRFLHRATLNPGTSVFILAHISDSTNYLFDMVKRMYNNLPQPLKPLAERSNRKELKFGKIDSEYGLGTAGSADIGRATNPHLLHMSEAAFYQNTDDLSTGLMQGVATAPGTEIIMESTANGPGNMFHNLAMKGVSPEAMTRFQTIFIPWYVQEEYRETPPSGFHPNAKEEELMELYDLDMDQIFWYRRKLHTTFNGDEWKLKQEYPCSLQEAFQTSGDSLIPSGLIQTARTYDAFRDPNKAIVMGVDGAGSGSDETAWVIRQGKKVLEYKTYKEEVAPMRLAGIIAQKIDSIGVDMVFLDVAYGYGCRDRLKEMGYMQNTMAIHFGQKPLMDELYRNKRAEMAGFMQEWFEEGGADIPEKEEFARDIHMIPGFKRTGSRGLLTLPPKEDIKEENGGQSPNCFDALALTFAYPVKPKRKPSNVTVEKPNVVRARSPFKSRRLSQKFVRQNDKPSELYVK